MRTLLEQHPQAANNNGRDPSAEQVDLPSAGDLFRSDQWRLSFAEHALTLTHLRPPESGKIRICEFYFQELRLATSSTKTRMAALRMIAAVEQNASMEQMLEIAGVLAAVSGASIECRSVPSPRLAAKT